MIMVDIPIMRIMVMIMDTDKLYKILTETTVQLRKGDMVEEKKGEMIKVVNMYFMQHVSEITDKDVEFVDVHYMIVGVNKSQAEKYRDEFVALLKTYPDYERFKQGLSYIEVGAVIGSQAGAFELFALGEVLGLWNVLTPEKLGITGADADELAGMGMVMFSPIKA